MSQTICDGCKEVIDQKTFGYASNKPHEGVIFRHGDEDISVLFNITDGQGQSPDGDICHQCLATNVIKKLFGTVAIERRADLWLYVSSFFRGKVGEEVLNEPQ